MRAPLLSLWLLLCAATLSAPAAEPGYQVEPATSFHARDAEIAKLSTQLRRENPDRFQALTYLSPDGGTLPYRFFAPPEVESGKRFPLVLALHGAGSRGFDNRAHIAGQHSSLTAGLWAEPARQAKAPCFVLAPQCPPEPQAWIKAGDWRPGAQPFHAEAAPPLKWVMALLDRLVEEYPIDPQRIYVLGASMGGYASWDLLTRYPERFAAAVPVCGALADGQADRIAHVPVWIFHGSADDSVSVDCSRRAFRELRAAGGSPRYTEFEHGDHGISSHAWTEPGLWEWLFAQRRQ